jgi:hypothetical protein
MGSESLAAGNVAGGGGLSAFFHEILISSKGFPA